MNRSLRSWLVWRTSPVGGQCFIPSTLCSGHPEMLLKNTELLRLAGIYGDEQLLNPPRRLAECCRPSSNDDNLYWTTGVLIECWLKNLLRPKKKVKCFLISIRVIVRHSCWGGQSFPLERPVGLLYQTKLLWYKYNNILLFSISRSCYSVFLLWTGGWTVKPPA